MYLAESGWLTVCLLSGCMKLNKRGDFFRVSGIKSGYHHDDFDCGGGSVQQAAHYY